MLIKIFDNYSEYTIIPYLYNINNSNYVSIPRFRSIHHINYNFPNNAQLLTIYYV